MSTLKKKKKNTFTKKKKHLSKHINKHIQIFKRIKRNPPPEEKRLFCLNLKKVETHHLDSKVEA
jgi:hypothetical protein